MGPPWWVLLGGYSRWILTCCTTCGNVCLHTGGDTQGTQPPGRGNLLRQLPLGLPYPLCLLRQANSIQVVTLHDTQNNFLSSSTRGLDWVLGSLGRASDVDDACVHIGNSDSNASDAKNSMTCFRTACFLPFRLFPGRNAVLYRLRTLAVAQRQISVSRWSCRSHQALDTGQDRSSLCCSPLCDL